MLLKQCVCFLGDIQEIHLIVKSSGCKIMDPSALVRSGTKLLHNTPSIINHITFLVLRQHFQYHGCFFHLSVH